MAFKTKTCSHLSAIDDVNVGKELVCEECVKTGDLWVHLRTCQTCGVTLCCDSSPNKHATGHYREHNEHCVVASAEPGERWLWCYEHELFKKY